MDRSDRCLWRRARDAQIIAVFPRGARVTSQESYGAIGRVELAEGSSVFGLVCAYRPDDAVDVTRHGSWPRYLASLP